MGSAIGDVSAADADVDAACSCEETQAEERASISLVNMKQLRIGSSAATLTGRLEQVTRSKCLPPCLKG